MTNCPTTAEDWKLAERRKNCTTGIYHCLRTKLYYTKEVCAPRKSLIQAGGCPYWNFYGDNVDRVDCRKHAQCPDKHFLSNEVYQYPFCYQSWSTITSTTTSTATLETSITTSVVSSTHESSGNVATWLIVLMATLLCAVVLALVVVIICFLLYRKRKQKDPEIPSSEQKLNQTARTHLLDPEIPSNEQELNRTATTHLLDPEIPSSEQELNQTARTHLLVQNVNGATSFSLIDVFNESMDALKNKDTLIIKGSPGSGKTSLAKEIMFDYVQQNWSCVWKDDWENVGNSSKNILIAMDNCFGNWNNNPKVSVYAELKVVVNTILNKINQYHKCKMVLIMTKEEFSWYWTKLCEDFPQLARSVVIDMDSEQIFSRSQKRNFVKFFTSKFTRDGCQRNAQKLEKSFSRLTKEDGIGFPLKVKLLCEIPNITFKSFCSDVMGCLKKHFNGMRTASEDTKKLKYAMLSYIMIKGRLSHDIAFDTQLGQRLNISPNEQTLKSHVDDLKPYLKKDKHNCFVFAHEVLYIALFKDFYDADEKTLLEYCNIDAIQEMSRAPSSSGDHAFLTVVIEKEPFKILAIRIRREGLENDFKGHILLTEEYKQILANTA